MIFFLKIALPLRLQITLSLGKRNRLEQELRFVLSYKRPRMRAYPYIPRNGAATRTTSTSWQLYMYRI